MAAHGAVEIAQGVDLIHQLPDDFGTGPALIAGVGGQQLLGRLVAACEAHHAAPIVIVHFDLRIHAEKDGAHRPGWIAGERGGSRPLGVCALELRRAAAPAGGQSEEGHGGHGETGQLGQRSLFHVGHLPFIFGVPPLLVCLFIVYGAGNRKPGPSQTIIFCRLSVRRIRSLPVKTGVT